MQLVPHQLESSNLDCADYAGGSLYLRFKSGIVYRYDDVGPTVLKDLFTAESAGKFFHHNIKGRYNFTRLNDDPFIIQPESRPFERRLEARA